VFDYEDSGGLLRRERCVGIDEVANEFKGDRDELVRRRVEEWGGWEEIVSDLSNENCAPLLDVITYAILVSRSM
jgi:hypothetical protein